MPRANDGTSSAQTQQPESPLGISEQPGADQPAQTVPTVKITLAQYVARVNLDELAAAVLQVRRPNEKLTLEQWDAAWAAESKKE